MAFDVNTVSYTYVLAGALTVAAGTIFYPVGRNFELVRLDALVGTVPTGTGSVTAAFKKNGTLVSGATVVVPVGGVANQAYTTVPALPIAKSGQNSTYANVLSPITPNYAPLATLAPGDEWSIDVTVVGGTVAGSNLSVTCTFSVA